MGRRHNVYELRKRQGAIQWLKLQVGTNGLTYVTGGRIYDIKKKKCL